MGNILRRLGWGRACRCNHHNAAQAGLVLSAEERQLIEALRDRYRWMPDPQITPKEAHELDGFFQSPLGVKLDVAMTNWAQQQAQVAIAEPSAEIARAAGFARGCMAGWQMVKTISRYAGSEPPAPDRADSAAAASLEHYAP